MNTTYVKYMEKEELIDMLSQIHRFEMVTQDGRRLVTDNRVEKASYAEYPGFTVTYRATAFKLSAFDYEDVLIQGAGYVRYNTWAYGAGESRQGVILRERYGFEREL